MVHAASDTAGPAAPDRTTPLAPRPANETERLAALHAYHILDTLPDPNFDAITRVAARVLKVPTAAVTFIDHDRQWLKSTAGAIPPGTETSREVAFCAHTILQPGTPLVVGDATKDPRFANNALVTGPLGIRFYAGMPLVDGAGHALGALCIIDTVARTISPDDLLVLRDLAVAVSSALDLHRSLANLRDREARNQAAVALNPQIPWTANLQGEILEVSPSLVMTLGLQDAPSRGTDWTSLVHPADLPQIHRLREHALSVGEPYDFEHPMRRADGAWRWFRSYAAPRRDRTGKIVLWYGSSEDITERRMSQAKLDHLTFHDGLTDLPNRAGFDALLDSEVGRSAVDGANFALVCLGLDDFNAINDRLGHLAGDAILQQLADRLRRDIGDTAILARFGSDEFFLIQRDADQPSAAARLAEQLSAILAAPFAFEEQMLTVTASIGVACHPKDGADAAELLRNATLALRRAKDCGPATCCFFEQDIDSKYRDRLSIKLDLQDALARNEFSLVYQPLIDLACGRVTGLEALIRWRHPVRGLVSPAEFISSAEETGLIIAIGQWVLEAACREAASWPDDIRVAVNLSAVQFRGGDLRQVVAAALAASGFPARRLELEITESMLLLDDDQNLAVLDELRGLGVRIVMDDFGTGYSSLSYLQRFPFDKLKIDRSLISRLGDSEGSRAVVRAVVGMCRSLNIAVTAEGVETKKQFDQVRAECCDQVQGNYVSRPVPASEIPALIAALAAPRRVPSD